MEKVADLIGDEYEKWGARERVPFDNEETAWIENEKCIFISSPTGSGKTYFILKVLLPYVLKKRQKLLYLVNRKILKGQIESELFSSLSYEEKDKIRDGIKIETYQTIEFELYKREDDKEEERRPKYTLKEYSDYQYVVCDECHYFLADSNFNMNTIFSFRLRIRYEYLCLQQ